MRREFLTDASESFLTFPIMYMIVNVLLAVVLSTMATTELSTADANSLIDQGLRMSGFVSTAAISIVTLTFSLTVLSIQIAAQSYSPRLLDAFLKDPVSKIVISVNLGAYTFCYTLQCFTNKSDDEDDSGSASVPAVAIQLQSVHFALVMVSFVNFIHFFVNGFRIEKILARAAASSLRAAQALSNQYPPLEAGDSQWLQPSEKDENDKAVAAPRLVFRKCFGCTL